MQGGSRRPYHGSNVGNSGYRNRGPYDRPNAGGSRYSRDSGSTSIPYDYLGRLNSKFNIVRRMRTVKEAIETNVLLSKSLYFQMDDVSFPESFSEEDKTKAYEEYLENHRRTALERFFLGHKDETWFLERYQNGDEFEIESGRIREKYAAFMSQVAGGEYDSIKLEDGDDVNISGEQEGSTSSTSEKSKNIPLSIKLPERLASAAIERFEEVLALSNIPPSVKKASIESLLRDSCEQFEAVFLSEPVYEKSLYRSGFAVFREGADLASLALKIENILIEGNKIYYSVQKSFTRQLKISPLEFTATGRISKDLGLSNRLLEVLCQRYDIEVPSWNSDDSKSETQRLDLNISALRQIFNICYYCGQAYSSSLEMVKACGDLHLRSLAGKEEPWDWERTTEWLDSKIEDLIRLFGAPFSPATEDNIIESKYVIRLDDSRFRCSLCSKLFKGPEFVIKHARLKHEEESRLALEQLSLLNMFLARPSLCAFLKSPSYRRGSIQGSSSHQSYSRDRGYASRAPPPPPPNADTRALRRPMKQYVDWDAPVIGDVEINYD